MDAERLGKDFKTNLNITMSNAQATIFQSLIRGAALKLTALENGNNVQEMLMREKKRRRSGNLDVLLTLLGLLAGGSGGSRSRSRGSSSIEVKVSRSPLQTVLEGDLSKQNKRVDLGNPVLTQSVSKSASSLLSNGSTKRLNSDLAVDRGINTGVKARQQRINNSLGLVVKLVTQQTVENMANGVRSKVHRKIRENRVKNMLE